MSMSIYILYLTDGAYSNNIIDKVYSILKISKKPFIRCLYFIDRIIINLMKLTVYWEGIIVIIISIIISVPTLTALSLFTPCGLAYYQFLL